MRVARLRDIIPIAKKKRRLGDLSMRAAEKQGNVIGNRMCLR